MRIHEFVTEKIKDLPEGNKKRKKKSSKSMQGYFFPGYAYYAAGESGNGDGGGESINRGMEEEWSQKYKSSINCSHPRGFSQKAHCASKKNRNESIEMEMVCETCGMCEAHANVDINENLRNWFKQKWVRFGPDGKIRGDCARGSESEGKPKCLPQAKAHALGKKGRASAAARKRREDPNANRSGPAINVSTKGNKK